MIHEAFDKLCADAERRGHFVELFAGKLQRVRKLGDGRSERWREIVELRITDRQGATMKTAPMKTLTELEVVANTLLK